MLKKIFRIGLLTASFNAGANEFKLTSADLTVGKPVKQTQILNSFGCTGTNISPQLAWSGAPAGTQSFAITMYDPDARTGSGWWHWIVFNIPANVSKLDANAGNPQSGLLPAGVIQGQTDFGTAAYGGPCPPPGEPAHRYIVTVYALKSMLPLHANASGALVGSYIQQNKIDSASMTVMYGRQ